MTGHDHAAALRARAERGTPAGAAAVLAAARASAPAALAPAPAAAARRHRLLAVAAAVLVAAALAAGVGAVRRDGPRAASPSAFCAAIGAQAYPPSLAGADLLVYAEAGADRPAVDALRSQLERTDGVDAVRYRGKAAAYDAMRDQFAGDPAVAESLRPEDLPTWFEVRLDPGASPSAAAAAVRRLDGEPEVRELASSPIRVLDVLLWVAERPDPPTQDSAELGLQPGPKVWALTTSSVRATATPEVADAVDQLDAAVQARGRSVAADDPTYDQVQPAAALLRRAAAEDCALHPLPFSTPSTGVASAAPTGSGATGSAEGD